MQCVRVQHVQKRVCGCVTLVEITFLSRLVLLHGKCCVIGNWKQLHPLSFGTIILVRYVKKHCSFSAITSLVILVGRPWNMPKAPPPGFRWPESWPESSNMPKAAAPTSALAAAPQNNKMPCALTVDLACVTKNRSLPGSSTMSKAAAPTSDSALVAPPPPNLGSLHLRLHCGVWLTEDEFKFWLPFLVDAFDCDKACRVFTHLAALCRDLSPGRIRRRVASGHEELRISLCWSSEATFHQEMVGHGASWKETEASPIFHRCWVSEATFHQLVVDHGAVASQEAKHIFSRAHTVFKETEPTRNRENCNFETELQMFLCLC